jgi:DnaJ-class molecular chaperone
MSSGWKGETGEAPNGDLYLVLHVQTHPAFERHDDNIYI